MALIPFIGRVLSHISSAVELVTVNLFYTCEFVPGNASAATSTPHCAQTDAPWGPSLRSTTQGPGQESDQKFSLRPSSKCSCRLVLIHRSQTTSLPCMVKAREIMSRRQQNVKSGVGLSRRQRCASSFVCGSTGD